MNTYMVTINDRVEFRASDGQYFSKALVENITSVKPSEEPFFIPMRNFYEIIRTLPQTEIKVSFNKAQVTVKTEKSKFIVRLFQYDRKAQGYPTNADKLVFSINTKLLYQYLTQTMIASGVSIGCDSDATKFEVGEQLNVISSDGKKLACVINTNKIKDSFLVPNKTLGYLYLVLKGKDEDLSIAISDDRVRFTLGAFESVSPIDRSSRYPDHNKFLTLQPDKHLKMKRNLLKDSVQRANIISEGDVEYPITLNIKSDTLQMVSSKPSIGEIEELLECEYKGEPITVAFDTDNLLPFISKVEVEDIELHFINPEAPMIYKQGNFTYLALPVRI